MQKEARQVDPCSAYLVILVLEILFYLIKTINKIEGLNICDYSFLYLAYVDDTTFILKNISSVIEIVSMIDYFSNYFGLNSIISKCEIIGKGPLQGVHVAVGGLKFVEFISDTVKILVVHFSYNNEIQNKNNFCKEILDIKNVLKLWIMQSLTIEGKIKIFKTLTPLRKSRIKL